jgi:aspartokinase
MSRHNAQKLSPVRNRRDLEVWKFGGASLADTAAIQRAATLIGAHGGPLVVVASALAGVTDLLLDGAHRSVAGKGDEAGRIAATFLRRHRQVARELLPPGSARRKLLATIDAAAREYRDLCGAVAVLGHLEPRASDRLVSRGERMSAAILAAALSRAGRRATYVDATEIIATDG